MSEIFSFLTVSVGGVIINVVAFAFILLILYQITEQSESIVSLIAAMISGSASLAWNFLGYKFVVFK